MDIITKLSQVLEQRKKADPNYSYVKKLYDKGTEEILKKVEEETFELNGEEVSVVSAMEALADVWDYKCDLIRDGKYYGS